MVLVEHLARERPLEKLLKSCAKDATQCKDVLFATSRPWNRLLTLCKWDEALVQ